MFPVDCWAIGLSDMNANGLATASDQTGLVFVDNLAIERRTRQHCAPMVGEQMNRFTMRFFHREIAATRFDAA